MTDLPAPLRPWVEYVRRLPDADRPSFAVEFTACLAAFKVPVMVISRAAQPEKRRYPWQLATFLALALAGCATAPAYLCLPVVAQDPSGATSPAALCRPHHPEIGR